MGTVRGWERRLRGRGGDGDSFEELDEDDGVGRVGKSMGTGGDGENNVSPCTPLRRICMKLLNKQ